MFFTFIGMNKSKYLIFGALLSALAAESADSDENTNGSIAIDGGIAGYYDTRGMPTATLAFDVSDLPLELNLNGFMEFFTEGNIDSLIEPYGEFRLSEVSEDGFGTAVEYNRDFSNEEGITRIGMVFEPDFQSILAHRIFFENFIVLNELHLGMKLYPVSTDNNGIQIGLYGGAVIDHGDIIFNGFFDYNFQPETAVTELQAGKNIGKDLYFVIEERYNGFMQDDLGLGVGLEFRF